MIGKNNDELVQDRFTDSHETFEQTFKTMNELYGEKDGVSLKRMIRLILVMLIAMPLSGCVSIWCAKERMSDPDFNCWK